MNKDKKTAITVINNNFFCNSFIKSSYFLCGLVLIQLAELSIGAVAVFAGPKKVNQSSADRFIPERLYDSLDLELRDLRMSGSFDVIPDDVESFIRRDSMMRCTFGLSLGELATGRVLHRTSVITPDAVFLRDFADFLKHKDYRVHPAPVHVLEAPQVIDDYYYRTMEVRHNQVLLALEGFDDEQNEVVDSLYLSLVKEGGRSEVRDLGSTSRRVSFLKWLSPTLQFVGARTGGWGVDEVVHLDHIHEVATFNTQDAQQLGVGSSVIGAHYLQFAQKIIVGFLNGALVEFNLHNPQQNRVIAHYPHRIASIEFASDESHVAIGTREAGVFIHKWPSFRLLGHISVENQAATKPLSWHPERRLLAVGTGNTDHRVLIYSVAENRVIFEKDVKNQVTDLAWSESGTELVISLGHRIIDGVLQESDDHLLVWAVFVDQGRIDVKRLGGFPQMTTRLLSISLDSSEPEGQKGRQRTKIFALTSSSQEQIFVFEYSSRIPKKHIDQSGDVGGFQFGSGFGRSSWIR